MSFDLAALDTRTKSEAGMPMTLISPKTLSPILNDAGEPVTITLRGRNSAAYKAVFRTIQQRSRERANRGITPTDDEQRTDEAEFVSACTVAWTFTDLDGAPFPCTPENIHKLWNDPRFTWILEQATRFAANDGNFILSATS
jgi:hypothetical protein